MNSLDFIYKRHSVRKFTDEDVPMEDIKKIIEAATYAPSGKNKQNWHFVVVRNKEKIQEIAKVIENKNAEIASKIKDEKKKTAFTKFLRFATLFRNAPVTILVYCGNYDITGFDVLMDISASKEEISALSKPSPGIQGVSAALENLTLAAANLGYGTCWMTSQNYAAKEISECIGFKKEGYFLAAVIPLGVPDGESKSPARKPLEEVVTIIE